MALKWDGLAAEACSLWDVHKELSEHQSRFAQGNDDEGHALKWNATALAQQARLPSFGFAATGSSEAAGTPTGLCYKPHAIFFGRLLFTGRLSVILIGDTTSAGKARRRVSSIGPSHALRCNRERRSDFSRFCAHCARACEAYLNQSECGAQPIQRVFRKALHKGYECFELKILAVSTAAPLTSSSTVCTGWIRSKQENPLRCQV